MLQLLGHYSRIPCDSETVRHLHKVHRLQSCTLANVQQHAQQVSRHGMCNCTWEVSVCACACVAPRSEVCLPLLWLCFMQLHICSAIAIACNCLAAFPESQLRADAPLFFMTLSAEKHTEEEDRGEETEEKLLHCLRKEGILLLIVKLPWVWQRAGQYECYQNLFKQISYSSPFCS